jgi:hypothetical protein
MIKNQTYTISNQLLNYQLLSSYITMFWNEVGELGINYLIISS